MNKSAQFENFLSMFGDFYENEESAYNDYYSDDSFSMLASVGKSFKGVSQKVATGAANAMSTRTKAALTGAAIGAGVNYIRGGSVFKGAIGGAGMGLAARGIYNRNVTGGIAGNVTGGYRTTQSATSRRLGLNEAQTNSRMENIRRRAQIRQQERLPGSTAPPNTATVGGVGAQTELVFPE